MIDDWTTFLLTGATALPAFMVLVNGDSLSLAVFVFVALLFAAIFASLMDESSPARRAAKDCRENDRNRDSDR
jgi:hypothetical protein